MLMNSSKYPGSNQELGSKTNYTGILTEWISIYFKLDYKLKNL